MNTHETPHQLEPKPLERITDAAANLGHVANEAVTAERLRNRVFNVMAEKEGCILGADTLFKAAYDKDFDAHDPQARIDRQRVYNLFNEKQRCGEQFLAMVEQHGYVPQVGTLFIGKDDPEQSPKQKRVYRMFKAENYVPSRDDQTMFRGKDYITWEPTPVAHTPVPLAPAPEPQHIRSKRKRKPANTPKKAKFAATENSSKTDWVETWKTAVDETITDLDENGLMRDGYIKPTSIQKNTASSIIGTQELRRRMHAARLLGRNALDTKTPITAEELVLMRLFNSNQKLLGQATPKQKVAVEIVLEKVVEKLDAKQQ